MNMVTVVAYTACENTSGLECRPGILSSVMLTETPIQTVRVKIVAEQFGREGSDKQCRAAGQSWPNLTGPHMRDTMTMVTIVIGITIIITIIIVVKKPHVLANARGM